MLRGRNFICPKCGSFFALISRLFRRILIGPLLRSPSRSSTQVLCGVGSRFFRRVRIGPAPEQHFKEVLTTLPWDRMAIDVILLECSGPRAPTRPPLTCRWFCVFVRLHGLHVFRVVVVAYFPPHFPQNLDSFCGGGAPLQLSNTIPYSE